MIFKISNKKQKMFANKKKTGPLSRYSFFFKQYFFKPKILIPYLK